jgi:hypothetical protein
LFFFIENNTLQFRPAIPRRSSPVRVPASHNLLVTSQIHNHHEQKFSTQHFDSDIDHDEGIDSAIESHSLSINKSVGGVREVKENVAIFFYYFIKSNKKYLFRIIIHNRKNQIDQYIVVQQDVKLIVYLIMVVI